LVLGIPARFRAILGILGVGDGVGDGDFRLFRLFESCTIKGTVAEIGLTVVTFGLHTGPERSIAIVQIEVDV